MKLFSTSALTAAFAAATLVVAAYVKLAYGSSVDAGYGDGPAALALLAVGAELLFVWRFRAADAPVDA